MHSMSYPGLPEQARIRFFANTMIFAFLVLMDFPVTLTGARREPSRVVEMGKAKVFARRRTQLLIYPLKHWSTFPTGI